MRHIAAGDDKFAATERRRAMCGTDVVGRVAIVVARRGGHTMVERNVLAI